MILNSVYHMSAKDLLGSLANNSVDMIYTDPPFGTGDMQTMSRKKAGTIVSKIEYSDKFSNYMNFWSLICGKCIGFSKRRVQCTYTWIGGGYIMPR